MDSLMLDALLAGLCLAVMTAPLGVFVVWRRMSYFGDSLAHSALLGLAIALWLNIAHFLAIAAVSVLIVIVLMVLQKKQSLPNDTILGIFSHTALSTGLVMISLLDTPNVDLMQFLLGDILSIGPSELWLLASLSLIVPITIALTWRALLLMTVHCELAQVEGIAVTRIHLIFSLLLAFVIAMGMKVVGILLITSLLIIPPATARRFAKSPEHMVFLSFAISCCSILAGILASFWYDTPPGPSIVVGAASLFIVAWSLPRRL
ncbi:MAG: iron chelate uptake ABC transporter family permease subunit [Methylococcales bacterium]|nr:iron chelate uptake ABC transporter family permease subunit [Methylococcales bacterium]MBT7445361.1 iron chelate uptake ABC transporter family permease subunit [Methylococcales bacterium]